MNKNLYSIPMEQSVLCIFMTVKGVGDQIEQMEESDFYATRHAFIFKHIKKLHSEGRGHDVEVISDLIRKNTVEGLNDDYLKEIYAESMGSAHRLDSYIKTLKEYTRRRALFNAGERIKVIASDITQYDSIQAVEQSESVLAQLENNSESGTLHDAYNLAIDLYKSIHDRMEARKNGTEKLDGIKTGFADLDQKLGTISKTDYVIIAARPSMGKTAMIQSLMLNISFLQQHPVLFQSAEMSKDKIMQRLVSAAAEINLRHIRDANIPDEKWKNCLKAIKKLESAKIMIDDMPRPSIADIRRNCRRLKQQYGYIGAVFIDYLTLLKSPIENDNNHLSVGAISKALKALTKEFECPVFCLSQLNRGVEKRPDKRPMMSDLRESGSLEEDADVIMFLYRDEYYNPQSKEAGIAEVIIGKARDGEVGTVRLASELQYSRFSDLDVNYMNALCVN